MIENFYKEFHHKIEEATGENGAKAAGSFELGVDPILARKYLQKSEDLVHIFRSVRPQMKTNRLLFLSKRNADFQYHFRRGSGDFTRAKITFGIRFT